MCSQAPFSPDTFPFLAPLLICVSLPRSWPLPTPPLLDGHSVYLVFELYAPAQGGWAEGEYVVHLARVASNFHC